MVNLVLVFLAFCLAVFGQSFEDANGKGVHGALFSSSGATANTSGTPIKIAGTFTLSELAQSFDEPVDGRLRYTGERTRTFSFGINFSFTSSANNINISLFVAKNGTVLTDGEINTRIGTGADVGSLVISYLVSLTKDQYLEAFLDTSSGNPTITTQHLTMTSASLD